MGKHNVYKNYCSMELAKEWLKSKAKEKQGEIKKPST